MAKPVFGTARTYVSALSCVHDPRKRADTWVCPYNWAINLLQGLFWRAASLKSGSECATVSTPKGTEPMNRLGGSNLQRLLYNASLTRRRPARSRSGSMSHWPANQVRTVRRYEEELVSYV